MGAMSLFFGSSCEGKACEILSVTMILHRFSLKTMSLILIALIDQ